MMNCINLGIAKFSSEEVSRCGKVGSRDLSALSNLKRGITHKLGTNIHMAWGSPNGFTG